MRRHTPIIVLVLLSLVVLFTGFLRSQAAQPSDKKASTASPYDFAAARKQWAFRHPVEPAIPKVNDAAWCKLPIDAFVLAKLEEKGLKPAPPADKPTLIRRAYFDLIGLPPTPEEVDAFVSDSSPDAFAKVVDHLLASPAYGQRWARHWLDVVRYTDAFDSRSVKGDVIGDGDVSQAWRYRDWVIKSLNEDLPYDEFITKQIAGDLLPDDQFNPDNLIATGLYVIGNWGPGDADKEKMLTDIVDDQIDVTGRAFLGLTLSCARCHDHKYDPIPTADYYGLAGIFFSSHILPNPGQKTAGSLVAMVPLASSKELAKRKAHEDDIVAAKQSIEKFLDDHFAKRAREMLPELDKYLLAAREADQQPAGGNADTAKLAAQHGLDRLVLDRWIDYLRRQLHPQLQRTLLATARHEVGGLKGLEGWTGPQDMPPNVVVNTTDAAANYLTITLPPRCVAVHPGQKNGVAVEWRSPIGGVVSLNGQVSDADSSCGNGIDWAIDLFPANGATRLAAGMFANGKQQRFEYGARADLGAIQVKPGDVIRVSVFPKGDYSCDTTVVELDIRDARGNRDWNLTEDVLGNLHAGNPHADRLGNSQVWSFSEVPDELPGNLPPSSTPSRLTALFNASDDDAANIADGIRDTMVALDSQIEELHLAGKKTPALKGINGTLYKDLTDGHSIFWEAARQSDYNVATAARPRLLSLRQQLTGLEKQTFPPIPTAHALQDGGTPQSTYEGTHDTKIQIRGRYDKLGDMVPRHFPRLLAGDEQPKIAEGSGRLQLAHWVASADNPLTARVMVNRIWQHHFGQGIVRTPNNFGKLGIPPTHPELLDYLACQFVSHGWSIKAMHRAIMLSAAYQQSSQGDKETMRADPENLLVGRMTRQRLEAEPIRDNLLFQAGNLDLAVDGKPTRDINTHRRSIYLMSIRSERSDYRTLFDAPDPNTIGDGRINSTVAPQALFMMDDPFVLAQTKAIAARVLKEAPNDDRARIEWLYRHLYSRMPNSAELKIGLSAMAQPEGSDAHAREAAWDAYCQVLICANEFVYID